MGERFGNYEILRKLAAGGMAEVFLAKQTGLGGFERLVCIKRILPHLGEQEDFIKMFQDEARIAANLVHPNIAQIYDIGTIGGSYYIAMEYVRGEDLRRVYNQEVARGRAMPLEPAANILMGAALGLDYAHRQTSIDGRPLGIVHRDVSPQNILVTYDGHAKIVDFGVAKASGKLAETRVGVLKGKYSYMSPEQAAGDPIDARTDIFALGITLYEVTTGVRLFKRESEIETLHAVIECQVTPPSELLPAYDPDFETIVMRALAHDPDERYQTAGDLGRDLERFLVRNGVPPGASYLGPYMQDLFAEKLADELMLGGNSSWLGTSTSQGGKQQSTRQLAPDEVAAEVSLSRSGASTKRRAKPSSVPSTEAEVLGEDADATVVEDSAPRFVKARRESSRSEASDWGETSVSVAGRSDWGEQSVSSSQTATQALPERSLSPVVLRSPSVDEEPAAAPPPTLAAKPWLPRVALVTLLVGVLGAAALIYSSGRGGHDTLPRSGTLSVDSEPRGARVVFHGPGSEPINARYAGARTPFAVGEGVPVDSRLDAEFIKEGFEIVRKPLPRLVEDQAPPLLFAELTPVARPEGTLVLLTTPAGAVAMIDGEAVPGVTPHNDVRVEGGREHAIELRLAGYTPHVDSVFVEPGARRFIEVALERTADAGATEAQPEEELEAQVEPAQASATKDARPGRGFLTVESPIPLAVYVGNRRLGETPLRKAALEAGLHKLRLESEQEGLTLRKRVRVGAGATETVEVKPRKGSLAVNAVPWAWVRVGTRDPVETPLRLELYEGDYVVRFECPDGRKSKETARVTAGKTAALSMSCRPVEGDN